MNNTNNNNNNSHICCSAIYMQNKLVDASQAHRLIADRHLETRARHFLLEEEIVQ